MTQHDIESPSEAPPPPPLRPRRRKLPVATLVLSLAAAAGVGFFAGVRVEKANVTPTADSTSRTGANLAALGFGNAANSGGNSGGKATVATPSPAATRNASTTGSANIVGTIAVVQGDTLYVTEANGDTVKVTTSDGTTVTKTATAAVKDLAPGESVVIRGV